MKVTPPLAVAHIAQDVMRLNPNDDCIVFNPYKLTYKGAARPITTASMPPRNIS